MDSLAPWLILIIAALVTGCVVLYCHLRQVESATLARETIFTDELEELRAQMDAIQERLQGVEPPLPTSSRTTTPPVQLGREQPWQSRVLQLARAGLKPPEIARELEISISEVELALVFPIRMPEE